jgi:hypothetical protein
VPEPLSGLADEASPTDSPRWRLPENVPLCVDAFSEIFLFMEEKIGGTVKKRQWLTGFSKRFKFSIIIDGEINSP